MSEFNQLLRDLDSEQKEVQDLAVSTVENREITSAEASALIAAAARTRPNDNKRYERIGAKLLKILQNHPLPDCIDAIEEHFDAIARDPELAWRALRILAELKTPEALKTFVRLLRRPGSRPVHLELAFVPLVGSSTWGGNEPHPAGAALFPELLEVPEFVDDVGHVYWVIQTYQRLGLLDYGEHPEFVARCVDRAKRSLAMLAERGEDTPHKTLVELEWVLDLLGDMENPEIEAVVRGALTAPNPVIRLFALFSAATKGLAIEPSLVAELAEQPSLRYRLWRELDSRGRLDLFPAGYNSQRSLAEAEMVHWLEFPTEMGRPPDEIEELTTVNFQKSQQQMFIFRFRAAAFDDGKWYVGIAGPYPTQGPPRLGGSHTFSKFQEWDSKSLDEHIRDYVEME